ncbi:MAG: hypothetical protein H6948_01060 [Zoogloeaceae bacterium]|nr:hypothetical protein [Zoogloeaceae bacterium]
MRNMMLAACAALMLSQAAQAAQVSCEEYVSLVGRDQTACKPGESVMVPTRALNEMRAGAARDARIEACQAAVRARYPGVECGLTADLWSDAAPAQCTAELRQCRDKESPQPVAPRAQQQPMQDLWK